MGHDYGSLVAIWFFALILGGWLLLNALIDLGAPRFRHWLDDRDGGTPGAPGETPPG
jgi:hypothetical protein